MTETGSSAAEDIMPGVYEELLKLAASKKL